MTGWAVGGGHSLHVVDEAVEGRDSFLGKRRPYWLRFPYCY